MERALELRLVARLKAGDSAAFEAIYAAYRPRLFAFLVRLSRRRHVAEDLLEETWLRLVTRATTLADDTCLAGWLFTVARNLHASWRRREALDDQRLSDVTPTWPEPARGETPFEAAARAETERRLEAALARLAVGDRELLLLVGEGFTPAETALALGLPPGTLRKRLQRARQRLQADLEADDEERETRAQAVGEGAARIWLRRGDEAR